MTILKYPRTQHIEGSRLQPGDEDLDSVPFSQIRGRHVVVEEKMDGANSAVSFDADGKLLLQSRGHYLTGGPRERHFALFKQWANGIAADLHAILGARYIMYGEWLYAKHTVYYDALPHYFMEFDVYDRQAAEFLSTERRRVLLAPVAAAVVSVAVLASGPATTLAVLRALVGTSLFKTAGWRESLQAATIARGMDTDRVARETDPSDRMEGLYIKVEENEVVAERYKLVRADFLTTVLDSGGHWLDRPILPNGLAGE